MGCSSRDKHSRGNRRTTPRSSNKSEIDQTHIVNRPKSMPESYSFNGNNGGSDDDCSGWGYCSEEQLEEILMKNLDLLYKEAMSKLIGLGYEEDVVMEGLLRNGYCYGGMDALSNVIQNTLTYLNKKKNENGDKSEGKETPGAGQVFPDLKHLQAYSLAGMVCLLQQVRPNWSKGDVMWCLLMSDLNLGKARTMSVPVAPSGGGHRPGVLVNEGDGSNAGCSRVEGSGFGGGMTQGLHNGWGFGSGGTAEFPPGGVVFNADDGTTVDHGEIECPKRFNLSPSLQTALKKNVAAFTAGYRANSKQSQTQSQACPSSLSTEDHITGVASGGEVPVEQSDESNNSKTEDLISSLLEKFCDMKLNENLEYVPEDQKDEMILKLVQQIKDLDKQVMERKDWAHQKAMQAARKLSADLTELKMLRMERDETQRLKKGKQALEDTTMKRLSEMENALRKASAQVDRANAAVRRLENENAEIRAEMEASKLSASESVNTCLEVAKREKKCLKRLLAWEKQKSKLQVELAEENEKIATAKQLMVQMALLQEQAEVKWKEELNAKELALVQIEEERHSKEESEADSKRRHEALRLKTEIDFQRHKDDLNRLEQEMSRLKASTGSTSPTNNGRSVISGGVSIETFLDQFLVESGDNEIDGDRECLICMKDEVSIVFLPCAHQVMCANCNDGYGKRGRAACPCCGVPIEQRIRVFGASS